MIKEKNSFTINRDIGNISKDYAVVIEYDGVISVMSEFGAIEYGVNIYSTATGEKARLTQSDFILIIDSIEGVFGDIESLKRKASELKKENIYNKPNELGNTYNPFYGITHEDTANMLKDLICEDNDPMFNTSFKILFEKRSILKKQRVFKSKKQYFLKS